MRRLAGLAGVALLLAAACGDDGGGSASNGALEGEITVSAAASLTDAFEQISDDFEAANPDTSVALNFGSSTTLATQIREGAPADVFGSASTTAMKLIVDDDLVETEPVVFARNRLEIAVEPGNPLGIESLEDLTSSDVTLVLCAETVPCGQYADEALAAAGIQVSPASRELDVRATLGKVELGEADAAIVYESDVVASEGRVDGVDIPDDENVPATYPIAVVLDSGNAPAAQAFVDSVLSRAGQETLAEHGFLPA